MLGPAVDEGSPLAPRESISRVCLATAGVVLAVLGSVALPASADATAQARSVVTSLLGDRDGLGYGLQEGQTGPPSPFFDNREPDDPAFTDLSPVTPPMFMSRVSAISYRHDFTVPAAMTLVSARLNSFTLGVQDGDSQVVGSDVDVRLFLDGTEVPGAFDRVDQFDFFPGGWLPVAGSVGIDIPLGLLPLLADGSVDVRFETHALGPYEGIDAYAIDFSELRLVFASCRVPKVIGRTLERARRILLQADCDVGRVRAGRPADRAGVVLAQSPPPGAQLPPGGRVDLTISKRRTPRR